MYSPRIDEELIPALYRLAKEKKIPMTRLVNGMLRRALQTGESGPALLCQEKGIEMKRSGSGELYDSPLAQGRRDISVVRVQMVREGRFPGHPGPVRNSSDAAGILRSYLAGADREYFVVLLLDQKHRINALNLVSVGTQAMAVVHPREVFKPALLGAAAAAILGHNHPSGDPEPSSEDRELTRRLVSAGEILGIDVLDHIVIGEREHVSFADRGMIPPRGRTFGSTVTSPREKR